MIFRKVLFFIALVFSTSSYAQLSLDKVETIVKENCIDFQLSENDVDNLLIVDNYTSLGIDHVYFKQAIGGIEIYDSHGAVHKKESKNIFEGSALYRGLQKYSVASATPLSIEKLLINVATQRSYNYNDDLTEMTSVTGANQKARYNATSISNSPIQTRLVYYHAGNAILKLGRIVTIDEKNSPNYYEFLVDASSGEIVSEHNYTLSCNFDVSHECSVKHEHKHEKKNDLLGESPTEEEYGSAMVAPNQYRVYALPLESPLYGPQTDVTEPWLQNPTASPNGWHNYNGTDFTHTRGNNVDAYVDDDDTESPTGGDAARASGGPNLEFLYTIDTNGDPENYIDGAVTNLFYWNNIIHDVWYNYGFDEASGNFQVENYTAFGNGTDHVQAEAQDGQGTCNANMSTPADGGSPRMQMYLCGDRDGDLDNGVIIHEFTHGISNRLTGGPGASGCLFNQEQMGEGWSDFYGLIMTMDATDTAETLRPIGNWLLGEDETGGGIRSYPYTTDMTANPFTYDDIKTESVPHGVGSVWSTMLWDMNWALIDVYGYDADLYNGTGGNNIAMFLVTEGMKLQPCSPGFVDGRDAILEADELLYNGANKCLIWEVFANRGLGYSANQGSSASRSDGTEAFDMPPSCTVILEKTADRTTVDAGGTIVYTITATSQTNTTRTGLVLTDEIPEGTMFVSASDNGMLVGSSVVYPAYTLAGLATKTWTLTVQVDANIDSIVPDFVDDVENGAGLWTVSNSGSTAFNITSAESNSGTMSWFANDGSFDGVSSITNAIEVGTSTNSVLSFTHWYDTEEDWDGSKVLISTDGGSRWEDLGPHFTTNGYNGMINNSSASPAFSGDSGGFITSEVNLSAYSGQLCLIKFEMYCDAYVGDIGWYVDDISITNLQKLIPNTAVLANAEESYEGVLMNPIAVNEVPFNCSDNEVAIEITFDEDPEEISLIVRDNSNAIVFQSGPYTGNDAGSTVTELVCMLDACYTIEFIDSGNNGLCNGGLVGSYKVKNHATGDIYLEGCNIGSGLTEDLCFPLLSYSYTKEEPSCVGATDAAIDLTLMNGNPNVDVTYSNNATTEDLSGIGAGIYSVIIEDGVSTLYDTIVIYGSKASVYITDGIASGSLDFAVANSCPTDTIRFEEVLMLDTVFVDQEVVLNNRYVKGLGADMVSVSGQNLTRIFVIPNVSLTTIEGLKLIDGMSVTDGGALVNNGKLTLKDVIFKNNMEGSTPKSLTNQAFISILDNVILQE